MKKNVYKLSILIVVIILSSCATNHNLKNFENKEKFSENTSVLGLNSVSADHNYYTKAILDHLLVKKIIDGNSINYFGMPEQLPAMPVIDSLLVRKMVIFPKLQSDFEQEYNSETINNLQNLGIKDCTYDLPKNLNDLKSGLLFNSYTFRSSNRAAMQAFGIVNSAAKEKTLYIITDYLQFQDINCSGIPIIRYAVGMRAVFRILGIQSESELADIGSLASLAAQVENKKQQVNITIKTIGITGIDSRLTIPSNASFDVKTFSDYEKTIDFIRNLKYFKKGNDNLIISPQIIPVMDEYRTTLDHSLYPLLESIELLELKLSELKGEENISEEYKIMKKSINNLKLELLGTEVNKLVKSRIKLIESDGIINNYQDVIQLIEVLNNKKISDDELKEKLLIK